MLERFKVPLEDQVRVPEQSLRHTVAAIFEKMGETPEDAALAAEVLVTAELRGVETHGVSMVSRYLEHYNDGSLKPRPDWRIVRETPATATIDAGLGLVVFLGPKAMRIAMDKARKVGVGVVTIGNSSHSGPIGHHAMLAAKEDMIGVVMTAAGLLVLPTFGAEPRLGTNPIAIAAPARNEAPFLFDAATSTVAGQKRNVAARVGSNLLPYWFAEKDGSPITEELPAPARDKFLLPLGGTREQGSHKGYGFGMMPEILAALLSGTLPNMLTTVLNDSHHFAAYNIEAFTDLEAFKDNMDEVLRTLRTTKPAPGHDRVLYPGLAEHEEEQDRRANGVPLHRELVQWFDDIAGELSVPRLERV